MKKFSPDLCQKDEFILDLQRFAEGDGGGAAEGEKTPDASTGTPDKSQAEEPKTDAKTETKTDSKTATTKSIFDAEGDKTPVDAKKDAGDTDKDGEKDDAKKNDGPPEQYDLKMPDEAQPDPALLEQTTTGFKALGLSNEQAQGVMDMLPAYQEFVNAQILANHQAQVTEWEQQTRAELGKDADKELAFGAKALAGYGNPELKTLLAQTGLDRHPLVTKFFIAVGRDMGESKTMKSGGGATPEQKSTAEVLYPKN